MLNKIKAVCQKVRENAVAVLGAVAGLALSASPSQAADLIDYAGLATTLATGIGVAITAAVGIGGSILLAKMGWKFFKSFTK